VGLSVEAAAAPTAPVEGALAALPPGLGATVEGAVVAPGATLGVPVRRPIVGGAVVVIDDRRIQRRVGARRHAVGGGVVGGIARPKGLGLLGVRALGRERRRLGTRQQRVLLEFPLHVIGQFQIRE